MLRRKHEEGNPYECKTVVPAGMCSFGNDHEKKKISANIGMT